MYIILTLSDIVSTIDIQNLVELCYQKYIFKSLKHIAKQKTAAGAVFTSGPYSIYIKTTTFFKTFVLKTLYNIY